MDIRTIIILLIIGHIMISFLSYGYFRKNANKTLIISLYAQLLFAAAYIAIYLQIYVNYAFANILGNSLLTIAMTVQMIILLKVINAWTLKAKRYYFILLTSSVLILAMYIIAEDDVSRRIILTTLMGIGIILYPACKLISDNSSSFYRRTLGSTYVFCIFISISRILMDLGAFSTIPLLSSATGNLLVCISFYVLMIINGIGLLFLIKENDDIELIKSANKDSLTGILNRKHLIEECEKAIELHKRKKMPISILVLDIDHFKQVNDHYGHMIGDKVLINFSDTIITELRSSDLFGRIGGEEFVVALPYTEKEEGFLAAERIRKSIESTSIDGITITTSIGLCTLIPENHLDFNAMYNQADRALYIAKNSGRNRTYAAEQLSS